MEVLPPTERIPTQRGTDLDYIRELAGDSGYVFYVEPGPLPGSSLAYFGPDIRIPVPQPALNINMDAHTNVESLSLSLDGLAKKIIVFTIFDPMTHKVPIPIPVPNLSVLRPPLGARPTPPAKVEFPGYGADRTPTEAHMPLRKVPVRPTWRPTYARHDVRIESWSKFLSEAYWTVELDE